MAAPVETAPPDGWSLEIAGTVATGDLAHHGCLRLAICA